MILTHLNLHLLLCNSCISAEMCVHRGGVKGHLSQELEDLIEEERRLDELIQSCTQQVRQMCEDHHSQRYPLSGNSALFCSVLLEVSVLFLARLV